MSFEFSLDPSDPLNFLMPGAGGSDEVSAESSLEDTSSSHGSPPEWSSLWNPSLNNSPQMPKKEGYYDHGHLQWQEGLPQLNFGDGHMDLDGMLPESTFTGNSQEEIQFDPALFAQAALSIGIDLSQVQPTSASPNDLLYPYDYSSNPFNNTMHLETASSVGQRRLSITSSSSSSGLCLSPDIEYEASYTSSEAQAASMEPTLQGTPFDDLVQQALKATGVTAAIQPIHCASVTQSIRKSHLISTF